MMFFADQSLHDLLLQGSFPRVFARHDITGLKFTRHVQTKYNSLQ